MALQDRRQEKMEINNIPGHYPGSIIGKGKSNGAQNEDSIEVSKLNVSTSSNSSSYTRAQI